MRMGWRRELTLAYAGNGRVGVLRPAGVGPPLLGEQSPVPSHWGQGCLLHLSLHRSEAIVPSSAKEHD